MVARRFHPAGEEDNCWISIRAEHDTLNMSLFRFDGILSKCKPRVDQNDTIIEAKKSIKQL
jgi:hypothetical protein